MKQLDNQTTPGLGWTKQVSITKIFNIQSSILIGSIVLWVDLTNCGGWGKLEETIVFSTTRQLIIILVIWPPASQKAEDAFYSNAKKPILAEWPLGKWSVGTFDLNLQINVNILTATFSDDGWNFGYFDFWLKGKYEQQTFWRQLAQKMGWNCSKKKSKNHLL